ncbi:MAG TPA: hypothetical protein VFM18_07410 [Methanosarcina sp.]|nr:hypothetical protein [Methanosarcina sp.]
MRDANLFFIGVHCRSCDPYLLYKGERHHVITLNDEGIDGEPMPFPEIADILEANFISLEEVQAML